MVKNFISSCALLVAGVAMAQNVNVYKGDKCVFSAPYGEIGQIEFQKTYDKYVVIGVWGQSNAVGYDESPLEDEDKELSPRLMQWGYNDNKLTQLTHCAKNAQDMTKNVYQIYDANCPKNWGGTKGIHLPLAQLIATIIPDDYGVIIVPAAFGGKTIDQCNSMQKDTFLKNLKASLDLNPENKLYGIIWCQGEFDADKNMTKDTYKTKFENMINDIETRLSSYASKSVNGKVDKSIWYNWEFPVYYKNVNNGRGREILAAQKEVLGESNYVAIPDDTKANTTMYTSSNAAAHFGQGTFRSVIAPAVFAKMKANLGK